MHHIILEIFNVTSSITI